VLARQVGRPRPSLVLAQNRNDLLSVNLTRFIVRPTSRGRTLTLRGGKTQWQVMLNSVSLRCSNPRICYDRQPSGTQGHRCPRGDRSARRDTSLLPKYSPDFNPMRVKREASFSGSHTKFEVLNLDNFLQRCEKITWCVHGPR
jgi:hypothetical protein